MSLYLFFQILFFCATKETTLCGNLQSAKVIYYEAYCIRLILYCIINLQLPLYVTTLKVQSEVGCINV